MVALHLGLFPFSCCGRLHTQEQFCEGVYSITWRYAATRRVNVVLRVADVEQISIPSMVSFKKPAPPYGGMQKAHPGMPGTFLRKIWCVMGGKNDTKKVTLAKKEPNFMFQEGVGGSGSRGPALLFWWPGRGSHVLVSGYG